MLVVFSPLVGGCMNTHCIISSMMPFSKKKTGFAEKEQCIL